ncbi:mitotic phase inducer phosphatase [Ordospora colligata]|uniref:M-phase inducer phosphatase n=1 Tax=Ordospora colligata OC4 TaxID=1354746 RepID=A0A0B2UKM4_9MICR|nr:mitotic phase inducer phosphatase [Ordospora colligata OC4]KHN69918.1 mitotic phase inducer phosphatase [Ordospora colligata OC4]TBU19005.1 mitotic phase inducer phosphatase [Ordospora colligata]
MDGLLFASSESDACMLPTDSMCSKPFREFFWSSSDDVQFEGLGNNPFEESSMLEERLPKGSLEEVTNRGKCTHKMRKMDRITSFASTMKKKQEVDFWNDFGSEEQASLPTLGYGKSDSIQRISVDVAKQVIEGLYDIEYQVIDCRFAYEYDGGHIVNAINISTSREVATLLRSPKVLIFHCEFSSIRAPRLAQCLRNMDRMKNPYPRLSVPEIYVMEGGYKKFYRKYPEMCSPQGYVAMDDRTHRSLCKKDKFRVNKRY